MTLPDSLEKLGDEAFKKCKHLKSAKLSESLKIIECSTFEDCKNLSEIQFPKELQNIELNAFKNTKWLNSFPDDFVRTDNGFLVKYQGHDKIVNIPDSVKMIGTKAFLNCKEMEVVNLSDSVKWMDDSAFMSCPNLRQIKIPNALEFFSTEMFCGCRRLSEFFATIKNYHYHVFFKSQRIYSYLENVFHKGFFYFYSCRTKISATRFVFCAKSR